MFIYQNQIEFPMVKWCGLLLVFVLFLPVVHAVTTVDVIPVTDHIIFGERATYTVEIRNQRESAQTYEITSPTTGILWDVKTKPISDRLVTIGPRSAQAVTLVVEPIENFPPSVYVVSLVITSNLGDRVTEPVKVYMTANQPREYLPSVRVGIDMDERIDPRDTQSVRLTLTNLNPLDLTGLTVEISSDISEFNTEQILDLPPGPGTSTFADFTFQLDKNQQPKEYFIFFQLKKNDEIIKVENKRIEILPITDSFTQEVLQEERLLKTARQVIFRNDGNVRNTQTVAFPVTLLERFFTSSEPKATIVSGETGRALTWEVELSPEEEVVMYVDTSYRVPLIALALILLTALFYKIYKNPLFLKKSGSNIHGGHVSGLKVTLVVKNLSNSILHDVEIRDQIPGIADVEQSVEMGTLKPHHITRGKQGSTIVKWKLSELEAKEERLITYKIKSKLKIVGTLQLPRARATMKTKSGKRRVSFSNTQRVNTEE
jgi:hypothetical protein